MKLLSGSRAQGTIEYLVIIAIVIVLALVVVSILQSQIGASAGVSKVNNKISGLSEGIGVVESIVSPIDGNLVVKLLNNSGDVLTISKVQIGDKNANFSYDLAQSNSMLFSVSSDTNCTQGSVVTKNLVITYVTRDGLTKTFTYPAQIMFDCTPYTIAQANLANQCPTITFDGNAIAGSVLSGYTFFSTSSTKQNGSLKKYVSYGTGQATCSDVSGNVINCSTSTYPGMDGNVYGANYVHVWRDNGDGTVSDLTSGLRWQKGDYGSNTTWQSALQYCGNNTPNLTGAGWRLPNFKEIIDMYDYNASTCNSVFSVCTNSYWSSTNAAPMDPISAYILGTGDGSIFRGQKGSSGGRARCVRFEN